MSKQLALKSGFAPKCTRTNDSFPVAGCLSGVLPARWMQALWGLSSPFIQPNQPTTGGDNALYAQRIA